MKYKPTGYHVLIEMDPVDYEVEDGALKGFQLSSKNQKEREESGQCIGTVVSFGNTCFKGFSGCDCPEDWGVKVGDRVEFNRYDGKIPLLDKKKQFRIITDADIIMVIEGEENE